MAKSYDKISYLPAVRVEASIQGFLHLSAIDVGGLENTGAGAEAVLCIVGCLAAPLTPSH